MPFIQLLVSLVLLLTFLKKNIEYSDLTLIVWITSESIAIVPFSTEYLMDPTRQMGNRHYYCLRLKRIGDHYHFEVIPQ